MDRKSRARSVAIAILGGEWLTCHWYPSSTECKQEFLPWEFTHQNNGGLIVVSWICPSCMLTIVNMHFKASTVSKQATLDCFAAIARLKVINGSQT